MWPSETGSHENKHLSETSLRQRLSETSLASAEVTGASRQPSWDLHSLPTQATRSVCLNIYSNKIHLILGSTVLKTNLVLFGSKLWPRLPEPHTKTLQPIPFLPWTVSLGLEGHLREVTPGG